ncbi:hypothetical protein ACWIGI_23125 [Nocardia sp. NPDC055321]
MTRRHRENKTGGARIMLRPALGALPVAVAIACAGIAQAVPQPGVNNPGPDTAAPAQSPRQPGTTVDPAPAPQLNYAVPQDRRPIPVETEPAPPVQLETLHFPQPVEPVVPIAPPPRTLRVGDFMTEVPDEVPDDILNPVNDVAAGFEAAVATHGKSIGIDPSRSDKIAAATAAGALGGGLVGAATLGVPAAVAGGAVGALAGAGIGAVVGTALAVTAPAAVTLGTMVTGAVAGAVAGTAAGGVGAIPGAIAGAAIALAPAVTLITPAVILGAPGGAAVGAGVGLAVGAAVAGVPAALAGAALGGVIGGSAAGAWAAANL